MNINELRPFGLLSLEPGIKELPETIHWWVPLKLEEQRIALVSKPGQYFLEISADQIERYIPVPEKINGVEAAAVVLNGRFSYEELDFVFRPHPIAEPFYAICDNCNKPVLTHHASADAFASSTISDNFTPCRHCGALKKWSKPDLLPLSVVKEQFTDDIIDKS
jgi:hypothetical protein